MKNLGTKQYIDNWSQNAVKELNKLGGALNGKLVVIRASDEPIQLPTSPMILECRSLIGWPAIDSQDTLSFRQNRIFKLNKHA